MKTQCCLLAALLMCLLCAGAAAQNHLPGDLRALYDAAYPASGAPDDHAREALRAYFSRELEAGETLFDLAVRPDNVCLLIDGDSGRRLVIREYLDGKPLNTIASGPLPAGSTLDTAHPGEHEVQIEWRDAEDAYCCEFYQSRPGVWLVDWVSDNRGVFPAFYAGYDGISPGQNDSHAIRYGAHPWGELSGIDFSTLPHTFDAALAQLDQRRYAVVCNPNPEDRLHLREKKSRSARSLGKFYNGTPVRVHGIEGDWARVSIGRNTTLEGYMMTKYLAFGADMNGVACAFPELIPIYDSGVQVPLNSRPTREGRAVSRMLGDHYFIIGVYGEDDYIFLTRDCDTGYAPQADFFPGNG